jgi:hypothetical protein
MKSDKPNECSFCGSSETDGARLWSGGKEAYASTIFICQDCVFLAAESEVVSPLSIFSFEGHELEWTAIRSTQPVLAVTVRTAGSSEGFWLPFRVEEQPTEEMARQVATKLRHLLKLNGP